MYRPIVDFIMHQWAWRGAPLYFGKIFAQSKKHCCCSSLVKKRLRHHATQRHQALPKSIGSSLHSNIRGIARRICLIKVGYDTVLDVIIMTSMLQAGQPQYYKNYQLFPSIFHINWKNIYDMDGMLWHPCHRCHITSSLSGGLTVRCCDNPPVQGLSCTWQACSWYRQWLD